jgi:hypothetical protein
MTRAFTAERRDITARRLAALRITPPQADATPGDVVRHSLAMQAQDYPGAKWSVGLRSPGSTDASIEQAIADRQFVRSWPMRGTLHFVAPDDLGWILSLTGERTVRAAAGRHRQLELDDAAFGRATDIVGAALAGGTVMRRDDLIGHVEAAGLSLAGQRASHVLLYLSVRGLIVFGPADGKQQTFTLLDEWVPNPRVLDRDEALGEFALRYFTSHGPATIRDFAWWSSLTLTDARRALVIALEHGTLEQIGELIGAVGVVPATKTGVVALPGFDEYILGYSDRTAPLAPGHFERIVPGGNGMFLPTIVADGEVVGTWKRTIAAKTVTITPLPFDEAPLTAAALRGFRGAASDHARFLGRELRLVEPEG